MSGVSPNTHLTIYACLMYAHIINIARPGTFEDEVNKMLKLNNLPPIKTHPPKKKKKSSQEIQNIMTNQPSADMNTASV